MSVQERPPVTLEFTLAQPIVNEAPVGEQPVAGYQPEAQPTMAYNTVNTPSYTEQLYDATFHAAAANVHVPAELASSNLSVEEQTDAIISTARAAAEKAVADYEAEVAQQIADDRLKAEADRMAAQAEAARVEREENAAFLSTLSLAEIRELADAQIESAARATEFVWGDNAPIPMSELNAEFAPAAEPAPAQAPIAPAHTPRADVVQGVGFLNGAAAGRRDTREARVLDPTADIPTAEYSTVTEPNNVAPAQEGDTDYNDYPRGGKIPIDLALAGGTTNSIRMEFQTVGGPEAPAQEPVQTRTGPRPYPDSRPRTDVPRTTTTPVAARTVTPPRPEYVTTWTDPGDDRATKEVPQVSGEPAPAGPALREAAPLPHHTKQDVYGFVGEEGDDDGADPDQASRNNGADTEIIPAVAKSESTPPAQTKRQGFFRRQASKLRARMRENPRALAEMEDEFMPGLDPRNDPNMVLVGNNYVDLSAATLPRGGMSRRQYRRAMATEFGKLDDHEKQDLADRGIAEFDDEGKVTAVNSDGAPLPLTPDQRDQVARDRIRHDVYTDDVLRDTLDREAVQQLQAEGGRHEDETAEQYGSRIEARRRTLMREMYFRRTVDEGVMASRPARMFGLVALRGLLANRYTREATEKPSGDKYYNVPYPTGGDGKGTLI